METLLPYFGLVFAVAIAAVMLFFSAVIAPLVFTTLEIDQGGKLIRRIFPWYYLVLIIMAALGAGALYPSDPVDGGLLAFIALSGLLSRQMLMPKINHYRDLHLSGDEAAEQTFNRLHKASVYINTVQLIVVLAVLVRLAP